MNHQPGRLPAPFLAPGNASFLDFVAAYTPEYLAGRESAAIGQQVPHGTTVVAASFADGVVLAGDRRATVGNVIASREIEKVFAADERTGIGIAGTAGMAIELVRLFQLELEHFEKIEGFALSLDGKANRLSTMLRSHLSLALQGLAVLPVLAGFDLDQRRGRIFSYDVTGGRFEESEFHCLGSGAVFARGALKKLWAPRMSEADAIAVVVESLIDAADDDSATGGPDERRGIWPVVAVMTEAGYRRLDDAELRSTVESIMAKRRGSTTPNEGVSR